MAEIAEVAAVIENRVCSKCKCLLRLDDSEFKINRHGEYNKTCIRCSDRRKIQRAANKCAHNKEKSRCKQCGGGELCIHDKVKSRCRQCGGSEFCQHDKRKSACKDCGGSQICMHGKQKSICRVCDGSRFCIHDKNKSVCKECGGASICEHNLQKFQCKECNFYGYISKTMRNNVNRLDIPKEERLHYTDYYGCNAEEYKFYIGPSGKMLCLR